MQHSWKLVGTNCHFKWVKVPGPVLTERPAVNGFCIYVIYIKRSLILMIYYFNYVIV